MPEIILPDLTLDKNHPEKAIIKLLEIVKPKWDPQIIVQPLSGGYSSKMSRCYTKNNPEDSVTVRIQNLRDEIFKYKPDLEIEIIQFMSKRGHFPKILAQFQNGYCYEYIKGKPMLSLRERKGVISDKMLLAIAKELAYVHSIDMSNFKGNYECKPQLEFLFDIATNQEIVFKHTSAPPKEIILKEFQLIMEYLKQVNPTMGLCHGDTHAGNMVWDEKNDKITFVDWEMVHIDNQYFDIAYFLRTFRFFIPVHETSPEDYFTIPDDTNNKFLNAYFQEWCKCNNKEYTEDILADFKCKIKATEMGPLLIFLMYPLFFPDLFDEFSSDKTLFFERTMKEYLAHKKEVMGKDTFETI